LTNKQLQICTINQARNKTNKRRFLKNTFTAWRFRWIILADCNNFCFTFVFQGKRFESKSIRLRQSSQQWRTGSRQRSRSRDHFVLRRKLDGNDAIRASQALSPTTTSSKTHSTNGFFGGCFGWSGELTTKKCFTLFILSVKSVWEFTYRHII
jgi:hypothetical protein